MNSFLFLHHFQFINTLLSLSLIVILATLSIISPKFKSAYMQDPNIYLKLSSSNSNFFHFFTTIIQIITLITSRYHITTQKIQKSHQYPLPLHPYLLMLIHLSDLLHTTDRTVPAYKAIHAEQSLSYQFILPPTIFPQTTFFLAT